jgi:hypothetical protein
LQFDWLFGYKPRTRNDPSWGGLIETRVAENGREPTLGVTLGVTGGAALGAGVDAASFDEVQAAATRTRHRASTRRSFMPSPWRRGAALASGSNWLLP